MMVNFGHVWNNNELFRRILHLCAVQELERPNITSCSPHRSPQAAVMFVAGTPPPSVSPSGISRWLHLLYLMAEVLVAVVKSGAIIVKSTYRLVFPPKAKSLQGEVVLVTGAAHGLGRQLALQFAASRCQVVCVDINSTGNEETARDINAGMVWRGEEPTARAYTCDVSDSAQVQQLAAKVGRVDILVNNAGVMPVQPMLNTTPSEVVQVINANLMSHFWMVLAFLPGMVSRNHGHLVAISSVAGLCGLANKVPYSASKYAVAGLMDALSEELRLDARSIKLTCVHPYFVNTRPDLPEDLELRISELTPQFAAGEIVDAVCRDVDSITVPRNLLFWLNVLRALPQDARNVWRDLFHTRVTPSQEPRHAVQKTW